MRVAAIYDVHANLPALEAVLQEIRQAGVDRVVVGGDVLPGPMPCAYVAVFSALLLVTMLAVDPALTRAGVHPRASIGLM